MVRSGLTLLAALLAWLVIAGAAHARASRMVDVEMHSDLLSTFWNKPMTMRADVLLPDSYDAQPARRYPVIYWCFGFGSNYDVDGRRAWGEWVRAFVATQHEAIVVFPDPTLGNVYTEFANSANNGPWGDAFVSELAPRVDALFRTAGRYVAGHSSGAWAALWLQTTYPYLFDGAWAYAPDPVDFHDFVGPDLTVSAPGNFYERNSNEPYTTVRKGWQDLETMREFVGGAYYPIMTDQFLSFEAVFSPKGADGTAELLFNRSTGVIDPTVAAYWEAHYDITSLVIARWARIGPLLARKIHLLVGTQDTFHLDGPAHRFCNVLAFLNAQAECTFVLGADHGSILRSHAGYERHIVDEIFLTTAG